MMALSKWGRDYGAALCLAPDRAGLPLADLTDAERACVTRVGTRAEEHLDAHFGVTVDPVAPPIARYRVTNAAGSDLGTLTFAGGAVNWCVPRDTGPTCGLVGYGHDGLAAALAMLRTLGMHTAPAADTPAPVI